MSKFLCTKNPSVFVLGAATVGQNRVQAQQNIGDALSEFLAMGCKQILSCLSCAASGAPRLCTPDLFTAGEIVDGPTKVRVLVKTSHGLLV